MSVADRDDPSHFFMTRRSLVLSTSEEQVRAVSWAPDCTRKLLRQLSLRLLLRRCSRWKLFRKEHMTLSWRWRSPRYWSSRIPTDTPFSSTTSGHSRASVASSSTCTQGQYY